jgi:hypothetical protein
MVGSVAEKTLDKRFITGDKTGPQTGQIRPLGKAVKNDTTRIIIAT